MQWNYLKAVLLKLGFNELWVSWIMMCVTSVEYHVLVNHDKMGPIPPSRGLRQGDPLSLCLYILCAEGLSALNKKKENMDVFHGVRICRGLLLLAIFSLHMIALFFAKALSKWWSA